MDQSFLEAHNDLIQRYFKGTSQSISDTGYRVVISGTFHLEPVPAICPPELSGGKIDLKIFIPFGFPFCPPKAFALDQNVRIFPHLRNSDGEICPPNSIWYNRPNFEYFLDYLNNFFQATIKNETSLPDDFYELPHFPAPENRALIFKEENPQSWLQKQPTIGTFLYTIRDSKIAIIESFDTQETSKMTVNKGIYIWLNDEPILRYRQVPLLFRELQTILSKFKLSLGDIIDKAYEIHLKETIVLIGFPIKERNKDNPSDLHWQAFILSLKEFYKKRKKFPSLAKNEYIKQIENNKIPYMRSIDCSPKPLYSRIHGTTFLTKVAIFGCGAIGSYLATNFARSGCDEITVIDYESLNPENICRHSLKYSDVLENKALKLSLDLRDINLWGNYFYFDSNIFSLNKEDEKVKKIAEYDLWIDAGLPPNVSSYVNFLATANNKRLVSFYIADKAQYLIIIISGKRNNPSIERVEMEMQQIIKDKNDQELIECLNMLQNSETTLIRPQAGCYFLTFEANNAQISIVSATTFLVINDLFKNDYNNGRILIYKYEKGKLSYNLILDEKIH